MVFTNEPTKDQSLPNSNFCFSNESYVQLLDVVDTSKKHGSTQNDQKPGFSYSIPTPASKTKYLYKSLSKSTFTYAYVSKL